MTRDREDNFEGDASDAMLDELLAQARWPEPDSQSESRLRMRCGMIRPTRTPVYRIAIAVAAMIAIVVGIWFVETRPRSRIAVAPPAPPSVAPPVTVEKYAPRVRPLGPVERLVLIEDKLRNAQRAKASSQTVKPDPLAWLRRLDNAALVRVASATNDAERRDNAIRLLLERNDLQSFLYFVLRPNTRNEALAVLHEMPNPPTSQLLAELNHRQVDYRLAAAKALGGLCDQKIDRTLLLMVATNNHRREAIAALLSCSDPHAKQLLSQAQAYASADEIRSVQHDLNQTF